MLEYTLKRLDCDLSWPEIKKIKNSQVQKDLMVKHQAVLKSDYAYLGNIQLDFEKIKNVEKENTDFFWRSDNQIFKNSFFERKYYDIEDKNFADLKTMYGLDYAKVSVQLLKPGTCIGAHFDGTIDYHNELRQLLPDYDSRKVGEIFNIFIMFLDDWEHGQAFMIGRDCYNKWKAGDVITFPWYMLHSTVNASRSDRTILYTVGAKLK